MVAIINGCGIVWSRVEHCATSIVALNLKELGIKTQWFSAWP